MAALPLPERERAETFLRAEDGRHWARSRLALRRVLSAYLGQEPRQIEISLEENGKPRLAEAVGLEFNLSHSGELALIVLSSPRPVGVDIEKVEPDRDLLPVAERALDAAAAERVRAAAPGERAAVFYEAWVRHEARLKCLGAGLTGPVPEAPVAVRTLDPGPGYAAAVAVAGAAFGRLLVRDLSPA